MWANMGRTFAETMVLERLVGEPGRIELADAEHWRARAAEPGPLMGITLHAGNWELAVAPITEFGRQPAGIYRPLENPLVDQWLAAQRGKLYTGGLLGKAERDSGAAGQRTARLLIDRARKGNVLCFVTDHFDRRGEAISFMGRRARFTVVPAQIARHVGGQVWVGRSVRIGTESRFRIEYRAVDVPRTADKRADALALTTAILVQFEAWIREHPEQWMWWNTRWIDPETPSSTD